APAVAARSRRASPERYPGQTPRRNVRLSRSGTLQVLVRLDPGAEHLQKRHIGRRRTDAWSTAPALPPRRYGAVPVGGQVSNQSSRLTPYAVASSGKASPSIRW